MGRPSAILPEASRSSPPTGVAPHVELPPIHIPAGVQRQNSQNSGGSGSSWAGSPHSPPAGVGGVSKQRSAMPIPTSRQGHRRLSIEAFSRISSPAKLHVNNKRLRVPFQRESGLPSPFVLADGVRVSFGGIKARGLRQLQRLPSIDRTSAAALPLPQAGGADPKALMIRGLSGGSPLPLRLSNTGRGPGTEGSGSVDSAAGASARGSGVVKPRSISEPVPRAAAEVSTAAGRGAAASSEAQAGPSAQTRPKAELPEASSSGDASAGGEAAAADAGADVAAGGAASPPLADEPRAEAQPTGAAEGDSAAHPPGDGGGRREAGDSPTGAGEPSDAEGAAGAAAAALPTLAELLAAAMPTPPALTIQQQSDSALMLLRCDWKEAGVVSLTTERLRRALAFLAELQRRAVELGVTREQGGQGAILQALLVWKEQLRLEEARRLEQAKEGAADEGAEPPAGVDAARQTLNSSDGKRDEPSPLLTQLGPSATHRMADDADDMRKLLRVKVADDQDIKTAQQALAESAYFFVALQQEADGLGVGADEQLKQYTF